MTRERFGWWGKSKTFFKEKPRMIWIGPMSKKEILEYYDEFRHNFRESMQESKEFLTFKTWRAKAIKEARCTGRSRESLFNGEVGKIENTRLIEVKP